jgi:gliding motility-associated lipoprotein GldK
MFLSESERFYRRKEIDTRKLNFEYYWIDLKEAARKANNARDLDLSYTNVKGQNNAIRGHSDRSKFIIKEVINVYPDTLVWVHDFTYSFNEPMTENYFWHPAYDDYPVVGVTWVQANAFNVWRTQLMNSWLEMNGEAYVNRFRLPTEAEWEYAARGGLDLAPYPWGGPYVRNRQGCFLGNFKPLHGNYVDDGGFHTVPVDSYTPNDYGLYSMSGNVSEWTSTAFDESVYDFDHDLNPEYSYDAIASDPPSLKRKVIRGGSWKDIGYYMQTGTRSYEYQDTTKAYIGFRSVMTFLGRGKAVNAEDL